MGAGGRASFANTMLVISETRAMARAELREDGSMISGKSLFRFVDYWSPSADERMIVLVGYCTFNKFGVD